MTDNAPISATILNVDDDEANLYVRTHALRRAGYQVLEANRGAQVMPMIATWQPDLVLLDVHLPDANGYDLCREIKTHPDHQSTIVIQTSASYVDRRDRLIGFAAGADSYLLEPIEPEELVANVTALLRMRSMERELRRSAIEWQKTFEAVRDGVAIIEESGIISRCNPAFELMAGQPSVGKGIDETLGSGDGSTTLRDLLAEAARTGAGTAIDRELHGRFLRFSVDPVRDPAGQVTRFACILTDVTAERQIAALNQQLTTTVTSLRRAKDAADEAARAKDEFLATLSHELRTPMTAIMGWAQMLRMFGSAQVNPEEAADAILASAKAQSQLVEDLLDLSRITTGKLRLKFDTVNVEELVDGAIQTIVPAAAAKRITIERRVVPASVAGDYDRLQQVLWNLLSNAVKFTPDGGRISVSVEEQGLRIAITVSDTGKGIDPQFLPAVFDRFSQAESLESRSMMGLGLGLAIVRHIVELHGGEVAADSSGLGQGATFRVMLPVAGTAEMIAPVMGERALPQLRDRRILLVEDSSAFLEMLTSFLRAAGARVFPVTSVRDALEVNAVETIDAVVTELSMPGENGLVLITALRADETSGRRKRVIVAMTTGSRAHDDAMQAGATACIEKPFDPGDLVQLLASF